ncbi:AFG3-like protein 2, partial [Aphis craccivora]
MSGRCWRVRKCPGSASPLTWETPLAALLVITDHHTIIQQFCCKADCKDRYEWQLAGYFVDMSQRFFTISKKVERLLMNGIRTGRLDNFALHRQLSLLSRRQVLPSLNTVLKQWTNLCEKPPTGFEKYFDKDKKSKQDDQKSNSRSSKPSFDSAFKKKINRMSQ